MKTGLFRSSLAVAVLVISLACTVVPVQTPQGAGMRELPLPQADLPTDALVLYEHIVIDSDRSGNWRFYFRSDGAFFNARNDELWVARENAQSDDPVFFWNTPFSQQPTRQLTAGQVAQLVRAIDEAAVEKLEPYYADAGFETTTPPWIERWTFVRDGKVYTIVSECLATPTPLAQLHETLKQLLQDAPAP